MHSRFIREAQEVAEDVGGKDSACRETLSDLTLTTPGIIQAINCCQLSAKQPLKACLMRLIMRLRPCWRGLASSQTSIWQQHNMRLMQNLVRSPLAISSGLEHHSHKIFSQQSTGVHELLLSILQSLQLICMTHTRLAGVLING